MNDQDERMQILEMIENGRISATEGVRLLQALGGEETPSHEAAPLEFSTLEVEALTQVEPPAETEMIASAQPEVIPLAPEVTQAHGFTKWRNWWMIPMGAGVAITVLGGLLMYLALQTSHIVFWFVCAGFPFAIGLAVMILAWQSRKAPWLHLRVQQAPGETPRRIAFSFPIPVRPVVWCLRLFGNRIPDFEGASLDELLLAVGENTNPDNPLYIEVDEGEDGEKVEIYIG